MTPHFQRLVTPLALCALSTASTAQRDGLEFHKVEGPAGRVHYDMATGKVTKLVRPRQALAEQRTSIAPNGVPPATVRSFNNTLTTGYFTTTPLGGELVDWAVKHTGGSLVTEVRFGYGSNESTCNAPGPTLDLSFYTGTSGGAGVCNLGMEVERISFAGLPGMTCSAFPGFGRFYLATAFLAEPFAVPDGQIGWGYASNDSDGMGGANTGPAMTDFGTNTGWSDWFQWYDAPASLNTCKGTFWFGGCSTGSVPPTGNGGTPCASFYMGLTEYVPVQSASCSLRNAGNPTALSLASPPQIGGALSATTNLPIAAYACTTASLVGTPLTGLINGTLLCDPTVILGGIQLTTTGTIDLPVPPDPGLEGMALCFQAAEFAGPGNFQLTNAFDCVIGG